MSPFRRSSLWLRRQGPVLGLLPFVIFTLAFLVLPAAILLVGSFQDADGNLTLANIAKLAKPNIVASFSITIQVSLASALLGGVFGFGLAWALVQGGAPRWVRSLTTSFSGVAANFAGVPLSFAFIATLGRVGMITALLQTAFGISLYDGGFNLYSFWGLTLVYLYFQTPLMVLNMLPALEGLKKEWFEASRMLGGRAWTYWRRVAFPVLAPIFFSSLLVLFGNAFGAYATAYALTGGMLNLVPIFIGAQIRGDVLHDPNLGFALAMGMVFVMLLVVVVNYVVQRRMIRWNR